MGQQKQNIFLCTLRYYGVWQQEKDDVQKKLNCQTKIFSQINISNSFDFTGSQPGSLSPEVENSNSSGFTVQRGRAVPTLTSVHQSSNAATSNSQQSSADLYKSDKEQFNKDTKSDELGEEGDNSLLNQVSFFTKTRSKLLQSYARCSQKSLKTQIDSCV